MRRRKQAREPEGPGAVLDALRYAPRTLRRVVSRVLASSQVSNLTISNIPGQACFGIYAQAELADDGELIARGIAQGIEDLVEVACAHC